jgi:mRNA interferase MazF
LSPVIGSEQGGIRPVLIVQNDVGNRYSPTVICAAITSQINKAKLPTEQVRTIDKKRLREKICRLDDVHMRRADRALAVSIGIG